MQGTDPWLWCQSAAGTQHSALTPAPCCYLSAIKRKITLPAFSWKTVSVKAIPDTIMLSTEQLWWHKLQGFCSHNCTSSSFFTRHLRRTEKKESQINYSTGNNPEDDRLHQLSNERAAFNLHDCNHRATGVIFLWEMKMFPVWLKRSKETDG